MQPPSDLDAVLLTLALAGVTTGLLLVTGIPLGWWLAAGRSRWRAWVGAAVTLPMVLPPVVVGFYMLLWLGPEGPVGRVTARLGLGTLPFTFAGLVVASTLASLPFVVSPLQTAFEAVGAGTLEAAATLGAGPLDRFLSVALPMSARGVLGAAILGFSHTVGEFGVVLMMGGNIPGKTRVLSVALFDHVESLEYAQAHRLAAGLVMFSGLVLFALYSLRARPQPL
jgi:molybdate transport system permease protein